jgi:hypothetical protein
MITQCSEFGSSKMQGRELDQQMWRPESGGWRTRPYEVAVGGAQSAAPSTGDPPPLQLIVQFVKPDPSMRPISYFSSG